MEVLFLMEEPLNRGGGGIALLIMEKIPSKIKARGALMAMQFKK